MSFIHVYEFITNQALLTEGFFSSELFYVLTCNR